MKKKISTLHLSIVFCFLYIPILMVIALSFNNARYSLLWHGATLKWYQSLLSDNDLIKAAVHSVFLGISASTFATVLGAIAAISLFRYRFWGRKLIHKMLFVVIIVPDIVIGIAFLLVFRFSTIKPGFLTTLLAHITFCMPYVFITANAHLSGVKRNIIEAAQDLGATERNIFFNILLPMLFPALLSGWLLSFTLSLDDVIISYFVTGPEFDILPLKIFSMVRLGVSPQVNALSTVLLGITLCIAIGAHLITSKKTAS